MHGVLDVHKHTQQNECLLHIQYFVIGKWNFLERVGGNLGHHKISDLFLKYTDGTTVAIFRYVFLSHICLKSTIQIRDGRY